eukprot:tig00000796_g4233.t1
MAPPAIVSDAAPVASEPLKSAKATIAGMQKGAYNEHSTSQGGNVAASIPIIKQVVGLLPVPAAGPVTFVDYGASQGKNSVHLMRAAVETFREKHNNPINVVMEDLPTNDWNSAMAVMEEDPQTYARMPGVFLSCVGRSFYEDVAAPASVNFGVCATSIHWLSSPPLAGRGASRLAQAALTPDELAAYRARAAEDWKLFLAKRATELAPGGKFVVISIANDGSPDWRATAEGLWDAAAQEMVQEGKLAPEEYAAMCPPWWTRSREEFEAPFSAGEFPGLRLDVLSMRRVPDQVWPKAAAAAAAAGEEASMAHYAAPAVGALRVISESFLEGALKARPAAERKALLDDLYGRVRAAVARLPGPFGEMAVAVLVFSRL